MIVVFANVIAKLLSKLDKAFSVKTLNPLDEKRTHVT